MKELMIRVMVVWIQLIISQKSVASSCKFFKLSSNDRHELNDLCDQKSLVLDSDQTGELKNAKLRELQKKLYQISGVLALEKNGELTKELLDPLIQIFSSPLGPKLKYSLNNLKYIFASSSFSNKKVYGLYLEPMQAIALDSESLKDSEKTLETIAHELGHALLFSKLSPHQFISIANQLGDWNLKYTENFYQKNLFERFKGINSKDTFPSSYSYENSHEWFAENFAVYLLAKLNYKKQPNNEMQQFFDHLLR